jgi:hypothetical protein
LPLPTSLALTHDPGTDSHQVEFLPALP